MPDSDPKAWNSAAREEMVFASLRRLESDRPATTRNTKWAWAYILAEAAEIRGRAANTPPKTPNEN